MRRRTKVTLDHERHIYTTTDGTILPSVTFILGAVGVRPPIRVNILRALERGRAVHRAIELWTRKELDLETVDAAVRGYFSAALSWAAAHPMRRVQAEVILYDTDMVYAGMADQIGEDRFPDPLEGDSWVPTLVDFKTGAEEEWHTQQLQGYGRAYLQMTGKVPNLLNVYLSEKGDYSCVAVDRKFHQWDYIMEVFNYARKRHMQALRKGAEGGALWEL
jgi:hypothetical protein